LKLGGVTLERVMAQLTPLLTAAVILVIFRSAIGIYLEDNPDPHLSKVSSRLFKEAQELLERRNQFLHSFWIGKEPSHNSSRLGYRFTKTKEGVGLRWLPTLEELEVEIEKVSSIFNMLCALNGIVRGIAAPELRQVFTFGADKKLRFDVEFAKSTGFRDLID